MHFPPIQLSLLKDQLLTKLEHHHLGFKKVLINQLKNHLNIFSY
jgi:hypothetical protein